MLIVAVLAGIAVGLLMGALGGGGAILTVPVLVYAFGEDAHQATTSSLVVVGVSSLIGLVSHHRAGAVRWKLGALFGLAGVGGAWLGAFLAHGVAQPVLLTLFSALLVVVAGLMARKALRARRRASSSGASGAERRRNRSWLPVLLTATGVGALTGFFGVGGGFAIVPALTLVLGFGMAEAVGTSLLVIAMNSAFSFLFHFSAGTTLDLAVVAPMLLAAVVGTFVGARLTRAIPTHRLQLGFAGFLLLTAAYMAVQNIPQL